MVCLVQNASSSIVEKNEHFESAKTNQTIDKNIMKELKFTVQVLSPKPVETAQG